MRKSPEAELYKRAVEILAYGERDSKGRELYPLITSKMTFGPLLRFLALLFRVDSYKFLEDVEIRTQQLKDERKLLEG
jgi:hypothetical protein